GCSSNTVRVWDLASRRQVAQLSEGYGYQIQFSPDGTLLAAAEGKTVKLWDVATWQSAGVLSGHTGYVYSFAFAPDGRTLAAGASDGTLYLWDVAGKRQIVSCKGHTSNIQTVAFAPDGRRLATGGADSTIKLWDVALFQEMATLTGHEGPVNSLAFSPDGNTLASAGADTTVRLWQAPPLAAVVREPAEAPSVPPDEIISLFPCNCSAPPVRHGLLKGAFTVSMSPPSMASTGTRSSCSGSTVSKRVPPTRSSSAPGPMPHARSDSLHRTMIPLHTASVWTSPCP